MKTLNQIINETMQEIERLKNLTREAAITWLAKAGQADDRWVEIPDTNAMLFSYEGGTHFTIWDGQDRVFAGDYWDAVRFIAENYIMIDA